MSGSRARQDRRRRLDDANATGVSTSPAESTDEESAEDTARDERLAALDALQKARGSDTLIAYVTSTRPNFSAVMALDVIRRFADHVPSQRVKQLDLFLHTDGGDSIVPWRLMTYLREYAETIHVLIPHRAFSAGTLTALGADEIVMHPMGMLGPIDPTVHDPYGPRDEDTGQQHGVGVEDVAAYLAMVREDFGLQGPEEVIEAFRLLADRVHPLTLGHVKRGTRQAKMLGEKLLKSRNDPPSDGDIETLLEELTRRLFFHGHPINRKEAAQLDGPPSWNHHRRSRPQCGTSIWPTKRI